MQQFLSFIILTLISFNLSAEAYIPRSGDISENKSTVSLSTYPLRTTGVICKTSFNKEFAIHESDLRSIPANDIFRDKHQTSVLTRATYSVQSRMLGGYIGDLRASRPGKKGERYAFATLRTDHGSPHDAGHLIRGIMKPINVRFYIEEMEYTNDVQPDGSCVDPTGKTHYCLESVTVFEEVRVLNDPYPQFIKANYKGAVFDIACQVPTALDILNY